MTFLQRLQNVLNYHYQAFVHSHLGVGNFVGYDKLKVKHNIKPEISTLESHKQALLHFMHGSFGLEFPRPLQPNIKYVLYHGGSNSNQMVGDQWLKYDASCDIVEPYIVQVVTYSTPCKFTQ